ncbi:uncharacterized protein LOC124474461 [Hypomesus transpacificus]|uniref:uncharacterized protein LOC124474461 n=1 Tax=Hypomesus transpacificus TaxID=137520 RepID=UPI001F07DFF3|nr:uncharacterized protein LOC124474461 [Hypomesus transpacificus]
MVLFGILSILASLRVCGASPPVPLFTKLTAVFGDTVVLPCDGAYYVDQLSQGEDVERALEWSAMGQDVLSLQGEGLTVGSGYEGRAFLPPEGLVKGNFSLELRKVVLTDANMYECIWQGRRTISTIWLHVGVPTTPIALDVPAGCPAHLPCYGHAPKDPTQMMVGWQKDRQTILAFNCSSGLYWPVDSHYIPNKLYLMRKGNFTLTIDSVGYQDQGAYRCFYRTSGRTEAGTPADIHLTVNFTFPYEDNWESTPTVTMLSDNLQEGSTEGAAATSVSPVPAAMATVTSSHLAWGQDEAMTSSPEPDIGRLETLPWVRIGILGGVLSLTALVLGILLATHKI